MMAWSRKTWKFFYLAIFAFCFGKTTPCSDGKSVKSCVIYQTKKFGSLSNCCNCADRAQNLLWPAPDIRLTMFQILSKSVHFRRSYSRSREVRRIPTVPRRRSKQCHDVVVRFNSLRQPFLCLNAYLWRHPPRHRRRCLPGTNPGRHWPPGARRWVVDNLEPRRRVRQRRTWPSRDLTTQRCVGVHWLPHRLRRPVVILGVDDVIVAVVFEVAAAVHHHT